MKKLLSVVLFVHAIAIFASDGERNMVQRVPFCTNYLANYDKPGAWVQRVGQWCFSGRDVNLQTGVGDQLQQTEDLKCPQVDSSSVKRFLPLISKAISAIMAAYRAPRQIYFEKN